MISDDPRAIISRLLADGWSVVGYSHDRENSEKSDKDWNSQFVLLQKDSRLRSYELLFDRDTLFTVTERELAPGVSV